jgi:hypothetical protein
MDDGFARYKIKNARFRALGAGDDLRIAMGERSAGGCGRKNEFKDLAEGVYIHGGTISGFRTGSGPRAGRF